MRAALVLCACLLVSACGNPFAPAAGASPDASQGSASAPRIAQSPQISQPPVSPPTPPGTNLPAFSCTDLSGGATGVANVSAARVAEVAGYDRFVLQFDSLVPPYTVKRQPTPVFSTGASGQTITLSGTSGALLTVHSATGANTFTGPTDFTQANFQVLKEARQTQDFEGTVSWGLGLGKQACMRTFTLSDPARLVIDLQTT